MPPTVLSTAMVVLAPLFTVQETAGTVRGILQGRNEFMEQCVQGGLELRFKYEFSICRRRSFWFDHCTDTRSEIVGLRYEPVSAVYVVTRDRLGDATGPQVHRHIALDSAFGESSEMAPMSEVFLTDGSSEFSRGRRYARGKVIVWCKQEKDQTLEHLAEGLSFGLARSNRFDSGIQELPLSK